MNIISNFRLNRNIPVARLGVWFWAVLSVLDGQLMVAHGILLSSDKQFEV